MSPRAAITAAPELHRRATSSSKSAAPSSSASRPYLGMYSGATGWESLRCGTDEIYTTSGAYAGCYGTAYLSGHGLRVSCKNAYGASTTVDLTLSCTDSAYHCITQTVIETQPDINTRYNYACGGANFAANTIFRTTTDGASKSSATAAPSSKLSGDASAAPTSGTGLSATTPSPTDTQSSNSASDHKGAIAGGVVGGIAALALIGLGVFFLLRRRKNKGEATPPNGYQAPPAQHQVNQEHYGMSDQKAGAPPNYAHEGVHEAPAHQWAPSELSAVDTAYHHPQGPPQPPQELPAGR